PRARDPPRATPRGGRSARAPGDGGSLPGTDRPRPPRNHRRAAGAGKPVKSARSSRLSVGSWQGVGWIRLRVAIFALSLGAGLLLVLGRAVHLQVVERDWLGEMAKSQYSRTLSLAPHRGEIVDREGATLASSVEVESIFLDPLLLGSSPEERQARLERLARVVELGPEQARRIARRLEEPNNRFVWLRRRVSP